MFNINSLAVKQISFKNFSTRRSNVIDAITIKCFYYRVVQIRTYLHRS